MSEITQADVEKTISECYWRKEVAGVSIGEPFGMNYFSNNIEVIGNIYDNQNLLDGVNESEV